MKKEFSLSVFLLTALLLTPISLHAETRVQSEESDFIRPVSVFKAKRTTLEEKILLMGNVKGWREADVFSKIPGKLKKYLVKAQQWVNKGDGIALIDQDLTGVRYQPALIKAPISGTVAILYLDPGEVVTPPTMSRTMGTPVARIVDMRRVRIKMRVPDRYYGKIRTGMRVEVLPGDGKKWLRRGKIVRIEPVIDLASRTFGAEAVLPNHDRVLIPGMFVRVRVITRRHENVVAVHRDTLFKRNGKISIMVVSDGVVEERSVKVGIEDEPLVEIISGVKEGEMVVISGPSLLHSGEKVRVVEVFEK